MTGLRRFLAASLAASLLASCGGPTTAPTQSAAPQSPGATVPSEPATAEPSGPAGPPEASAPAASAPAASAPEASAPAASAPAVSGDPDLAADLVVWGWEAAINTLKEVEPDFKAAYPNINVEYVIQPPADTYRNIQLAVSAGSGTPDVSVIEDSHLAQFVELGALADITDQVAPYKPLMNQYKWQAAETEGRTYAMPWDSGPVALYYRRDVFDEAGVDPASIRTWDDYYEAAKTIEAEAGVPMLQNSKARNSGRLLEMLIWQRGLGYVDADGAVILDREAKIAETLEYLGRFWEDDLALDNEEWTDPWYAAFADGEVATQIAAVWMGTFFKSFIAPEAVGDWGVIKLPIWEEGDVQASNDGGSQLAIFEPSEQKEAAWAYVEFHLGRPESQLTMYREQDIFPSLETTYDDPFFSEPDEYFGGDEARALFAEVVAEIPSAGMYTADYQEMNAILAPEIQRYAMGEQTAQQALANAATAIRDQTQRP
jgi:lactose/L-arabinose transport system substrate-binding protein